MGYMTRILGLITRPFAIGRLIDHLQGSCARASAIVTRELSLFLAPKNSAPSFRDEEGRRSGVGGYLGGKEVYVGTIISLDCIAVFGKIITQSTCHRVRLP